MKHPLLFLAASLTVFSFSLKAQTNFQPGYYITLQHDTIFGEIDMRGEQRNSSICTYRSNEDSESISFAPGEISAYRFSEEGKYYISHEVLVKGEAREVFLEFLVNGISNLYYYRGEGFGRYFIESGDGLLTELTNNLIESKVDGVDYTRKSNLYVGQMKASFADCPEIQAKLDNAGFNHKSLIKLTSEYHEYTCDGEECIIYEKELPLVMISGGAYLGVIRSSLDFPSYKGSEMDFNADAAYKWYQEYTFQKQTDLVLGLRFRFTLPRANEKLALILLAEYSQSDFYSYTEEQTNPGLLTEMEANAHISSLNTMLGMQYTYPRGKIKPSLAIGPLFSMDLNSYFDIYHTLISDSREIYQDYHTEPVKGLTMGGFSQLGADWAVRESHHIGCNLRYHINWQRSGHYIRRDGISLSLYYILSLNMKE